MPLSKSQYIRGLQCYKSLWLYKNKPELRNTPNQAQESLFNTGFDVGDLAKQLFPHGVEIEFNSSNFDGMITKTKELIQNGCEVIYEATFKENGIFAMADILVKNADSWDIYEVKASTNVKEYHLNDASVQWYSLNNAINLNKVYIVHINNSYERNGNLDIKNLFSIVDITEEVQNRQYQIPFNIEQMDLMLKDEMPNIDIGTHCNDPYPCDAKNYCWSHIPNYSIFDISRLKSQKKFELYQNGILEFSQIKDISSFSISQQIQIESERQNRTIINKEAIKEFVNSLSYPIYHLDFETFQQAIPEFKGVSPYSQIPFQYSLHIEHKDGRLEHKEFLALDGVDPREQIAKRLVEDIPNDVTVLAYNMGFEKGVIRKLANLFEQYSHGLMAIHDNCKDLMIPFQNKDYYHPNMKGSYSIKYVLPSLVPEFENAYKELDLIHNGGEAMEAFANLSKIDDEKLKQRYRDSLLEYCKLDTLAMVKILEKLKECVR